MQFVSVVNNRGARGVGRIMLDVSGARRARGSRRDGVRSVSRNDVSSVDMIMRGVIYVIWGLKFRTQ